ncbi:MAG: ATP phosphoribosyltransferase regulatory subunit [Alphaproteobacteria bacterium]|nr:ATP phosphoribosyltransferase regulatory subunit [Alphaproteobacteria bacterium]
MTELARRSLLPAGLQDVLPPDAAHEAEIAQRLLGVFASHAYERVKPPFVEFEEGLLSGTGAALANQTFRLMDPISQRMMAVRSDVTPQVARIAQSRLARAPRPLRLSYAEDILRVRGSELRPERQFGQVGYELIGAEGPAADAEVILLALDALGSLEIGPLTVDLNAPTLVTALINEFKLDRETQTNLRNALNSKDAEAVGRAVGGRAQIFLDLLGAMGPSKRALERLSRLSLPQSAKVEAEALGAVADLVVSAMPTLSLTIDPVEHRGFEYQTGLSFSVFGLGAKAELGRGGRYRIDADGQRQIEPATGCTLFMDTLVRTLERPRAGRRVFVPFGTAPEISKKLRADDFVTVAGLQAVSDNAAEAKRLGCGFVVEKGAVTALKGT